MVRIDNETHAIWYANVNGSHWVKQIVRNCNEVVKKGKGDADIMKRITFDLYDHEMSYPSQTITEYLKTFKAIVSDNHTKQLLEIENGNKVNGFRKTLTNSIPVDNKQAKAVVETEEPQAKKPKGDHYGPSSSLKDTAKPADPNRSSTAEIAFCNGCGITHVFFKGSAGGKVCRFLYMKHPDYNSEDKPWAESTKGKAYAAKKLKCLSETIRL